MLALDRGAIGAAKGGVAPAHLDCRSGERGVVGSESELERQHLQLGVVQRAELLLQRRRPARWLAARRSASTGSGRLLSPFLWW